MKFREVPFARDQLSLFPTSLDDAIPEKHPIRLFCELLDRLDWKPFEDGYRIERVGQPPINPRFIVAAIIFGIHRDVRSSRKLEYSLKWNIEFMWLVHNQQIDHSTFAAFRKRHRNAIKTIHHNLISLAQKLEVVKLGELYVDGTRIKADANRSKTLTADKALALLEKVDRELEQRLDEMDTMDQLEDLFESDDDDEKLPVHLQDLKHRRAELQRILETCQDADAQRKMQSIDPKKNPFQLPIADQDSRILPNKEGGYAPNYTPIIGVEGELGLIVSTTVINTPNEQNCLIAMVDDVEQRYGVTIETIGADAAYSIITNVVELSENRNKDFLSPDRKGDVLTDNPAIREDPTQPVADDKIEKLPRDPSSKKFSTEAFVYDAVQDVHFCPAGRTLHRCGTENAKQRNGETILTVVYKSKTCENCPLVIACRGEKVFKKPRTVRRDRFEEIRRAHREKMSEPEVKARYAKRFDIGEKPFGQIKHNFGIRRFSSRGIENVESEWNLFTVAFNLRRLLSRFGTLAGLRTHIAELTP